MRRTFVLMTFALPLALLLFYAKPLRVESAQKESGAPRHSWVQERANHDVDHNFTPSWWVLERERRQMEIDEYVLSHQAEFLSFKNAPLAIKLNTTNLVGVPMIMFRLLPMIFPDIWGTPQDNMASLAFGQDPFEPSRTTPLGTGYALSGNLQIPGASHPVKVNYATLTCMACHSGGYTNRNGELVRMIGAPNPAGDLTGAIHQTVNDARYTAANFRAALAATPIGYIYGNNPQELSQEILERNLFNAPGGAEFFLGQLQYGSNLTASRLSSIPLYTYHVPNPPPIAGPDVIPGQIDVFTEAAASLFNPSVLTPEQMAADMPGAPAPADILGAWAQSERSGFQWDDSVSSIYMRETAASLSVDGGNPPSVNQSNLVLAGNFTIDLPPAPYPYEVDSEKAARGKKIYQQACLSCHNPGHNVLMTPTQTGTDPNRAYVFTPNLVTGLLAEFRAGCLDPQCFAPGGGPLPDSQVLSVTREYVALPLAGLWATAPYLHNGSVPTLYHLLTGERPTTFYRGNFTYDENLVGYTWDSSTRPQAVIYDTTQAGHSNQGHTGAQFNGGIDWNKNPQMLWDLLEYLKTL